MALATGVEAAVINVAEFHWATQVEPELPCPDPSDPVCVPTDAFALSFFMLTNIWDGPEPAPALFDNRLTLPSGDVDFEQGAVFPFDFVQVTELGIPDSASIAVSFVFEGATVSLNATLTQPDSFAVLQFSPSQPVPEPGTLALVALGAIASFAPSRRKHA
jgi:hypothetical protein